MIQKTINIKPVTFGGPTKSGAYPEFKNAIIKAFSNEKKLTTEFSIDIKLRIEKSRVRKGRCDLDNFLKPIIDALDGKIIEEHLMKSIKIDRIEVEDSIQRRC